MDKEYLKSLCRKVFPQSVIDIKNLSHPVDKGLKALIKKGDSIIQVEFKDRLFATDRLDASQLLAESEYILEILYDARFRFEGLVPF